MSLHYRGHISEVMLMELLYDVALMFFVLWVTAQGGWPRDPGDGHRQTDDFDGVDVITNDNY